MDEGAQQTTGPVEMYSRVGRNLSLQYQILTKMCKRSDRAAAARVEPSN